MPTADPPFEIPDYIPRPLYLERIAPYMSKDIIKVIVGQRRVGKSYMLFQIMDRLAKREPKAQLVYVNKERHEFVGIRTADDLIAHVDRARRKSRRLVLLIDEVQEIEKFENALRHYQAEGVEIYCTGSNAGLLSGELATRLSGRYVEIKVYCLSYREFLEFHELERSPESFRLYLKFGGLPYLRNLALEDEVVFDYLRNILDAILLKDVVARHSIRNVAFLQRLATYVADNVGSILSAKRISDFLKSQKVSVSHNLVIDYLAHLHDAFLVFRAQRMDVAGRKIFEIGDKQYFEDLGLRHALVGYRGSDIGKVLENAVYSHLLMAGYRVWVGWTGTREIDFVCERRDERLYVQAAYQITDDSVRDREFGNLLAVDDNHPKVVVSMDEGAGGAYKGVRHVGAEEFLHEVVGGSWK